MKLERKATTGTLLLILLAVALSGCVTQLREAPDIDQNWNGDGNRLAQLDTNGTKITFPTNNDIPGYLRDKRFRNFYIEEEWMRRNSIGDWWGTPAVISGCSQGIQNTVGGTWKMTCTTNTSLANIAYNTGTRFLRPDHNPSLEIDANVWGPGVPNAVGGDDNWMIRWGMGNGTNNTGFFWDLNYLSQSKWGGRNDVDKNFDCGMGDGTNMTWYSTDVLADGNTHRFRIDANTTTVTFYIDGKLECTIDTLTGGWPGATTLLSPTLYFLEARKPPTQPVIFEMDRMRIWQDQSWENLPESMPGK